MIDEDTLEIIKRKDQNKGIIYKLGFDQRGIFERVMINRKEHSVAIDRLDMNWLVDEPILGRRDMFTPSRRHENALDFVRYHFWLHKLLKFEVQVWSHYAACSYRYLLRSTQSDL